MSSLTLPIATVFRPVETTTFRLGRCPGLDGLRGISILLVLIAHVQLLEPRLSGFFTGGFLGVDVFFVISGFLITCLLLDEHQITGRVSLKDFYIRRGLRLLPALATVLIFTCLLGAALGSLSSVGLSAFRLLSIVGYFLNWVRAFESPQSWFLGHFWSLSVEEQFYMIWPAILIILLQFRRARKYIVSLLIMCIVASFFLKAILYLGGASQQRLLFGSDTRAEPILVGCLLAALLYWNRLVLDSTFRSRLAWLGAFIASLFVVISDQHFAGLYFGGFTIFSLSTAAILLNVAVDGSSVLASILSRKWLLWIGKRSYGIYLWHWPVFKLAKAMPIQSRAFVPLALLATFSIAAVSYRYIEAPFLRLKSRFSQARDSIASMTTAPSNCPCSASSALATDATFSAAVRSGGIV